MASKGDTTTIERCRKDSPHLHYLELCVKFYESNIEPEDMRELDIHALSCSFCSRDIRTTKELYELAQTKDEKSIDALVHENPRVTEFIETYLRYLDETPKALLSIPPKVGSHLQKCPDCFLLYGQLHQNIKRDERLMWADHINHINKPKQA